MLDKTQLAAAEEQAAAAPPTLPASFDRQQVRAPSSSPIL
jgi:hypothetical protein